MYLRWLLEFCTNTSFSSCQATVTESGSNQLSCISIQWELGDPTFVPLVMGLCDLHSGKDMFIFPRQQRAFLITIWLFYLSLVTLFPEERTTSLGKTLPSYPQINGVGFFPHEWLSGVPYLCTTSRNRFGVNGLAIILWSSAILDAQEISLLEAGTPRKLWKRWILNIGFKILFDSDLKKSMKAGATVMHTLVFNFQ